MPCVILSSNVKPTVAPKKISKNTVSSRSPPLKQIDRPNDYLSVAERVNGRAAMIGFTSAVIDEIMTGNSISTPVSYTHLTLPTILRV